MTLANRMFGLNIINEGKFVTSGKRFQCYTFLEFFNEYFFPDRIVLRIIIVFPKFDPLKGLSHEIDFKNFDKNLQNLT